MKLAPLPAASAAATTIKMDSPITGFEAAAKFLSDARVSLEGDPRALMAPSALAHAATADALKAVEVLVPFTDNRYGQSVTLVAQDALVNVKRGIEMLSKVDDATSGPALPEVLAIFDRVATGLVPLNV